MLATLSMPYRRNESHRSINSSVFVLFAQILSCSRAKRRNESSCVRAAYIAKNSPEVVRRQDFHVRLEQVSKVAGVPKEFVMGDLSRRVRQPYFCISMNIIFKKINYLNWTSLDG